MFLQEIGGDEPDRVVVRFGDDGGQERGPFGMFHDSNALDLISHRVVAVIVGHDAVARAAHVGHAFAIEERDADEAAFPSRSAPEWTAAVARRESVV